MVHYGLIKKGSKPVASIVPSLKVNPEPRGWGKIVGKVCAIPIPTRNLHSHQRHPLMGPVPSVGSGQVTTPCIAMEKGPGPHCALLHPDACHMVPS